MYIDSTTTLTVEVVDFDEDVTVIEFANGTHAEVAETARPTANSLQPGQAAEFTFDAHGLVTKISPAN